MKKIILLFSLFTISICSSQSKNFINQPYIEINAYADKLVIPDKIYINIILNESDSKNKKSTEELEKKMVTVLKSLNIDIDKNLTLLDFTSDFKKYFLKGNQVIKSKVFSLIVNNANVAGKVLAQLEEVEISNVSIEKTEYSKANQLMLVLKANAILKAKNIAENILAPLQQKVGLAIHIIDSNFENQLQGKASGVNIRGISSLYGNRSKNEPLLIDFNKIKFSSSINVKFKIE